MVKRASWLSITPEPERELPEAVATLAAGHRADPETDRPIEEWRRLGLRNADGSINNFGTLAPRNIVDANIMWKSVMGSKVDLSAFINNMFEEHYYTYILDVSQGFQMGQFGQPRTYGGRIRYNFFRVHFQFLMANERRGAAYEGFWRTTRPSSRANASPSRS